MPLNPLKSRMIELPKIEDRRGNLSFIEAEHHIPFRIKRASYLYNVPGGESRGGHAYKTLHELIVALSGSFDVVLDDGAEKTKITLNRAYRGLYIPPMVWRHIENFSTNAVCVNLVSEAYDPEDYLRDYDEYLRSKQSSDTGS